MTGQFPKTVATARAVAALHGILAEPSRDERGRPTIILTRGAWTREVAVAHLADALAELADLPQGAAE